MLKLSDLKPKSVTFEVCGVTLTFRPFLIADDLESEDIIGSPEEFQRALQDFDFDKLSLLAWYQLDIASQRTVLKAVDGVYLDAETGKEIDAKLSPIAKFRVLFAGIADQQILIESLFRCRGLNIPSFDNVEKVKKWAAQLKSLLPSTGQ